MKDSKEKRVYLLLKSVIFYYHGLDEEERINLEETVKELDAEKEFEWVMEFIAEDYVSAFERAREYLNDIVGDYPKEKRIELINMVWQANNLKGYVTEMEASAMMKLAKDWNVKKELLELVF